MMLKDNPIDGVMNHLKTRLSTMLHTYVDNAWGYYTFNASTGVGVNGFPFPAFAMYAFPYAYFYEPAIATNIKNLVDNITKTDINQMMGIESFGFILSAYYTLWNYYNDIIAYNTGLSMAQEFVDYSMIHNNNLPYNNYNPGTHTINDNILDGFWYANAVLPFLAAYLKNDNARLNKIKTAEQYLIGLNNCVPSLINADTGAGVSSYNYDHNNGHMEGCLIAYGLTGDNDWLTYVNIWKNKILTYQWSDAYQMFLMVDINGVITSPTTGVIGFEHDTISQSFAALYRLGQCTSNDLRKAMNNLIYTTHLFQHGVKEAIGYDKNYIYNVNYSNDYQLRPEYPTACALLYSLTNDELWLRMGLQYWNAVENICWANYGLVKNVNLDTLNKTDTKNAEWGFEFQLLPLAWEKIDLINHPLDSMTFPFINTTWP